MNEHTTPYAEKMEKTLAVLKKDFTAISAGRANPAVIDKVTVDYFGTPTPINQMAAVSVAEARILVIQPWDASQVKSIVKALQTADLGINPVDDGRVIRLTFPQPTAERRKELAKQIRTIGEDSKVAIRSIRRDALEKFKALKKSSEITEDDLKDLENEMQKQTDKFCKSIDEATKEKENEIMEI